MRSFKAQQLARVFFIQIRCDKCGDVRQGLGFKPGTLTVECPCCGRQAGFSALGQGYTSRPLPFHKRWESSDDPTLNGQQIEAA